MNRTGWVCVLSVMAFCGFARGNDFPLRDLAVTETALLATNWLFRMDPTDAGITGSWFAANCDRTAWKTISIPGVWDQPPGHISYPIPKGIGWYHRRITVPDSWTEDVSVISLGAFYITDAWLCGEYLGVHRGGFSPFEFAFPNTIKPGSTVDLVFRVDSRLSAETIPGGNLGWQAFGGLTREVYLVHRPNIRPERLATWTLLQPQGSARLHVRASMNNLTPHRWQGTLTTELRDRDRILATRDVSLSCDPTNPAPVSVDLEIPDPPLWSPSNPHLCRLSLAWTVGVRTQELAFPIGLRTLSIQDDTILINGQRLWLQGFGHHEELARHGPCLSRDEQLNDLRLMKEIYQANTLRPGHYPNHPALYNLCDELGLLVFSEIPAWQIRKEFIQSDAAWNAWMEPQLTEMVTTLRNHPSVAFWGIANEIDHVHTYFKRALDHVRTLDPSRPATMVLAASRDLESMDLVPMVARNFHYGWYHSDRVYELRRGLGTNVLHAGLKPIWVSELGAHATPGNLQGGYGDQSRGSEFYQDKVIRFGFQYAATESDRIAGISIWSWADFHRKDVGYLHGLLSEDRQPKLAAYTVCNLYQGHIRLFVCEEDTVCLPGKPWTASLRCLNTRTRTEKGLSARWKILKGSRFVTSGSFGFDLPAQRSFPVGTVRWDPPADADPGLYTFWVELFDAEGRWLYTNNSLFDLGTAGKSPSDLVPYRPGILRVRVLRDGRPAENAWASFEGIRVPVFSFTGLALPLPEGSYSLTVMTGTQSNGTHTVTLTTGQATELVVDLPKDPSSANP